jgi:uncharacterized protein
MARVGMQGRTKPEGMAGYSRYPGGGAAVTVECTAKTRGPERPCSQAAPDTTLPFSARLIQRLKGVIGMNHTFKAAISALVLAVGFAGSVAAGPFEDAGTAYMKGDYARASRLLRPLAEQGNADAQARLTLIDVGAAYRTGDYETAVRLVRPLAEQGNVDAQARLAYLYANGEGVPQDYEAAVGWYQKAAEQGNAIAQYNLGDMYRIGEGVPPDNAAAASWYRRAAEQGHSRAQNNLGVMYDQGEGVRQDRVTAHMWFSLAAARGFNDAVRNRDAVAPHMTSAQVAEAQELAREWKPTSTPAPR